jgi:hypothetical protein
MAYNNGDFQAYFDRAGCEAENLVSDFSEWTNALISNRGFAEQSSIAGLTYNKVDKQALEFGYLGNNYVLRLKIILDKEFEVLGRIQLIEKDEFMKEGQVILREYHLTKEGNIPKGSFAGYEQVNIRNSIKAPFFLMLADATIRD